MLQYICDVQVCIISVAKLRGDTEFSTCVGVGVEDDAMGIYSLSLLVSHGGISCDNYEC